ncbi:hypothetical protein OBBRIDRAFT_837171 [Obba rivulosa]|uniref:DUF6533 domain-containing protein n=1 Tax=Obba rivulosa TaxID=1052685 RepID=A0A8E2AST0_9APHY|nr:hypothetical protein OBBRIDRAFT_837171 [Obba rivulosa]
MSLFNPNITNDIALVQSAITNNYYSLASCVFVLYDHGTTLSREIDLMWGRKWTSVTMLFYLNRFAVFAWAILQELNFLPLATLPVDGFSKYAGSEDPLVAVATRTSVIAADILILFVTWSKTYGTLRNARRSDIKVPISTLLLRDGTLYFIVLLVVNIMNIVGWYTDVFVETASLFSTPLSSIIITHFLLNLRQAANAPEDDNHVDTLYLSFVHSGDSGVRFGSFVDNIGADLVHNPKALEHSCNMSWAEDDEHAGQNFLAVDPDPEQLNGAAEPPVSSSASRHIIRAAVPPEHDTVEGGSIVSTAVSASGQVSEGGTTIDPHGATVQVAP